MTKERKLAIQMWEGIKANLPTWFNEKFKIGYKVREYKLSFIADNNLNWHNSCWLCQYISYCSKCPLAYCAVYDSLFRERTLSEYITACDIIIECLKGNLKVRGNYDRNKKH